MCGRYMITSVFEAMARLFAADLAELGPDAPHHDGSRWEVGRLVLSEQYRSDVDALRRPAIGLGDIAAGSLVVYRDEKPQRPELPVAEPEHAPFPLSLAEQRALLSFAERQASLSPARRAELAAILAEPLEVPPEQAQARINGIARGLLGTNSP